MLRVIFDKKSITNTDLSIELNISKATCSRTADGLIKLGFVEKMQADQDGRSFELSPTPNAARIHNELNLASGDVTKRIKKIIGGDQFETTVNSLRGISTSLR